MFRNSISGDGYNPIGRTALDAFLIIETVEEISSLKSRLGKMLDTKKLKDIVNEIRDMLVKEKEYEHMEKTLGYGDLF